MDIQRMASEELFPQLLEQMAQGKQAHFVVSGMSMWPLLHHNRDIVFLGPCGAQTVKKGDIVLFYDKSYGYVLHRVMKKKANQVRTAGDAKCRYDGWISSETIKAKVIRIVRKNRVIECSAFSYRFFSGLWRILFPIRKFLIGIYHFLQR